MDNILYPLITYEDLDELDTEPQEPIEQKLARNSNIDTFTIEEIDQYAMQEWETEEVFKFTQDYD